MSRFVITLFVLSMVVACEQAPEKNNNSQAEVTVDLSKFPASLQKIFAKHGSLEKWHKMNSMAYEIVNPEANEKQFIHLKDRREKIEGRNFTTGFDGNKIWVEADTTYKGNPVFYHNLMFYFYAMPFVIADDGIIYSEAEPLNFEGVAYPGIKISYQAGVGYSPEDEYFIHYDPNTYQMTWLGYTVTYFSKEKSKKIKWIRYDDWKESSGLLLPNSITWYNAQSDTLTEPRNTVTFANVKVTEQAFEDQLFEKTANATYVDN